MLSILPFSIRPLLALCLAAGLATPALAQKKPASKALAAKVAPAKPRVFEPYEVQTPPEYAEGQYALQQYLRRPTPATDGPVRGIVQVSAVVQPDGRLTDVFVVRGLSAGCNAEALRLVKAMPRWRPARSNNQPVAARTSLVFGFEPAGATVTVRQPGGDLVGLGQPVVEEVVENKAYMYVEQMPVFPGGQERLIQYIQASLRYPAEAVANKVEDKVFVKFIVGPDGKVVKPEIVKGIGAGCDEEVLRVVRDLPVWEPGKQNGRQVSVYYTVPVNFSLQTTPGAPGVTTPPLPPVPKPEEKVYTYVEQMPTVRGAVGPSTAAISAALQTALQLPADVVSGRSGGTVYVSFVVRPDSSATDAKVVRSLCSACDEAALAAVRGLPKLVPGKQNGRPVSVQLTMPVPMYGPGHVFEANQVATAARFPGNDDALRQYLTDALRTPKVLKQENLQGAVEVRFVVQADGKVGAAEVSRPLCRSCDEEALRLVRAMPRWTPARNAADQPVAVRQRVLVQMPARTVPNRID
ncbi:energy transducer TonB [Hymenobacter weizhouensis]|uniref:energy transducer TonB n=1 Tax=Hymenobacter sp. YIM 151500-1 TaxID=2987689 RepID=UPI002226D1B8|nr:energy transducer TonB [Hymenobacter sp. YIM 151500-1]UYZ61995.1 energy transducer TonB [Hymenobacter sp. YIM 151500-1]